MAQYSDKLILRERAQLGIIDPFYLSKIVGLDEDTESPRNEREVRPYYFWLDTPRPEDMPKKQKWLRFWSTPRYSIKTYGICVYLTCEILRDPNTAIIYQSQEKQQAIDAVDMIRNWLSSPEIVRLYGKFESSDWTKSEFTISQRDRVRKDPTMRALGLDNPMQGTRCDIMVWDDMVGETNFNNEEGLLKVERRIQASLPIIRTGGKGFYICTRWSPYDMTTDGYTISNEPGIRRQWINWKNEPHNKRAPYPVWECVEPRGFFGAIAQKGDEVIYPYAEVGKPLYPSYLDEAQIERERQAYTSHAMFASQILNDPIPDDTRYFTPDDIQYFDFLEEDGARNQVLTGAVPFMAVDLNSGKTTVKHGDDTTIAVIYVKWIEDVFHVYVAEWIGGRWKPSQTRAKILELVREHKPRKIYPETNMGKEYFLEPLRKEAMDLGIMLPIEEVTGSLHGTGKKEVRISAIQPSYSYKRVWHERHLKNSRGEEQLLKWQPKGGGHDDYPDVLAYCIVESTKKRYQALSSRKQPLVIGGGQVRYRSTRI